MEKEVRDDTGKTVSKAGIPSFDFLACSVYGLFGLMVFSGVFLAVRYVPTFTQAFSSVEQLNETVPFGWMVRRLHGAGGSLLLLALVIHLLRILSVGAYKVRPRIAWVLEVLLVFSALWINLTGTFLPLSQSAFWGMNTILSSLSSLPWVGSFMVDFLRGGRELGGTALVRFYSMHIGFSALVGLLLFFHHWMGTTEGMARGYRSANQNLLTGLVLAGLLLSVTTFLPGWFVDPLKGAANPTLNPERVSFPWYILFMPETLPLLSAAYPSWTLTVLILLLLLLFLLPFIDRSPEQDLLLRPFVMAFSAAFLIAGIYFSVIGSASAHYGERVMVPNRLLSAVELRGAKVFAEKNCAYCHQVAGRLGRRQGPDMTVVAQRGRSRDWIQRFIFNARLYQPGTAMPRYEIPLDDLEALSAYLLSLDGRKETFTAMDRFHLREMSIYSEFQREEKR
jgi:ubiquinol-cytochrome c reductase cytochrome b subunit